MPKPTEPNPWRFMGLGLEMVGVTVVLTLMGMWIDCRFDTGPWCAVAGALLGSFGGLYNLIRQAMRNMK